jgi:serine/threonine protein phosphatase 1
MTPDLTYAIGDIHGCRKHLELLLAKIEAHAAGRPHQIITCGDYVDRGPDSKGVLDLLISRPDIIQIMGNHEEMLLEARDGGWGDRAHWMKHGGAQTCASFGVESALGIPAKYIDYLRNGLKLYHEDEHRVFVHAGISPSRPNMETQPRFVMLWVRDEFLMLQDKFFKYVVHGHTPRVDGMPDILHNRANIDTMCFSTGHLTCVAFDRNPGPPIGFMIAAA